MFVYLMCCPLLFFTILNQKKTIERKKEMGADYSKMGIVAMSIVSGIEREHVLKLRLLFQNNNPSTSTQQQGNSINNVSNTSTTTNTANNTNLTTSSNNEINLITKQDFELIIKQLDRLDSSDLELLEHLFILLDESGECKIDYKDFLIGISILVSGTLQEKLLFAFTIYDENNTGYIMLSEMKKVLMALNLVTSFFGDPVISNIQIKDLVIDIFKLASNPSQLKYGDYIDTIASHPIILQFINGKGTVRFGR